MKAYPQELRERVVAAYEQKVHSLSEVAELFGVGLTFLKTMLKRHRKGESLAPLPVGGSSPSLDDSHLALLRAAVEIRQDATLEELKEFLAAECEIGVSRPTVCRALQKLDLPRKKKFRGQRTPAQSTQSVPSQSSSRQPEKFHLCG